MTAYLSLLAKIFIVLIGKHILVSDPPRYIFQPCHLLAKRSNMLDFTLLVYEKGTLWTPSHERDHPWVDFPLSSLRKTHGASIRMFSVVENGYSTQSYLNSRDIYWLIKWNPEVGSLKICWSLQFNYDTNNPDSFYLSRQPSTKKTSS